MNIVLAAEESAGLQLLRILLGSKHRLVAVLTTERAPDSVTNVWNTARKLGCETWPAELVKSPDLAERLRDEQVDILLNVHSLHRIHPEVLAVPQLGAFNLHPGPLPRYAGRNPVSWAIFRGEREYGVTIHRMDSGIDTGPVVYQSFFPITAADTALSLSLTCAREGVALMWRLVQAAEAGADKIPLVHQDAASREYFAAEAPEKGQLCWTWPAEKVVNFVRACDYFPFKSPWGYPKTRIGLQEIALVKASRSGVSCDASPGTVGKSTLSGVYIACRDEWILADKLLIESKYVPAVSFLRPGDRLASQ
jgi:methionyl-tRNA formyltransferase